MKFSKVQFVYIDIKYLEYMNNADSEIFFDKNNGEYKLKPHLGIDMSSAMNMFLKQCVMRGGLPFAVEISQYRSEVLEAMEEARRISKDPNTKRYGSFAEALEDLDV